MDYPQEGDAGGNTILKTPITSIIFKLHNL